ncbi:MAG: DUF3164 family protein [Tannerellaceae bacterium]|jgi:hypothetical protein|nr:DUF3164 family protein [Tannerellaceae bacterium]
MNTEEMSIQELEEALRQKKDQERHIALRKREAYEGIRADLMCRVQHGVETLAQNARDFANMCNKEASAFRDVMGEYGQLRSAGQLSYTLREGDFKWEIKSNKVKRFDERADVAAERLIYFLREWIQKKKDGTENPMYQLAMTLLERNRYGDLDYKSISKLYDLESQFDDPEYSSIMQLFKESNVTEGTAINYYFYRKDQLGVWRKIEPSFCRL